MKNKKVILMITFLMLISEMPTSVAQGIGVCPIGLAFQKPISRKGLDAPQKFWGTHRGMAAWYSKKDLHVRRHTANGEIFDDAKKTCAVWGIPFGTRLKVTNLEN